MYPCTSIILSGKHHAYAYGHFSSYSTINYLPLRIQNCNIDIFADDATLHKCSNSMDNINSNLQEDVNNVSHMCKQNNMILNKTKKPRVF